MGYAPISRRSARRSVVCASAQPAVRARRTHHITVDAGPKPGPPIRQSLTRTPRTMMMTRTSKLILAAAALATLGTAALSATEASAFGFRHGGFHHFGFRSHWSHFSHYRYHWHWNRYHFAYHRWPHYRPYYWRTYWRGPAYYGAVSSAPVQAPL